MPPRKSRTIDGFPAHPSEPAQPPTAISAPAPEVRNRRTFTAPPSTLQRRHWWHKLLFPLCILLCLCGSFVLQSLPLGMAALAIYAVVAWLRKLPGRVSFVLAFLSLATVVVLLVVKQNVELASNFATYTFLFLVVGIISSVFESQANIKRRRGRKR